MHWKDIPRFPTAHYRVDVELGGIERQVQHFIEDYDLDLNPDFQRSHVWTPEQQIAFVEYFLRGGESGRDLYFNHPGWMKNFEGQCVIVDGKQRLEAVRAFIRGDIKAFGHYYNEFEGSNRLTNARFSWHVACLKNKKDVLEWYIAINRGGTPHTDAEISKVKALLIEEQKADAHSKSA